MKISFLGRPLITFVTVYLIFSLVIVPIVAPIFGREKVKHINNIYPVNYMTVLLNRNYVRPDLNKMLQNTAKELENTGIYIHYLDANFPFMDSFPLLPHLSHSDGKKIDVSLIYETPEGIISSSQKSMSGYGVFEPPKTKEFNQIAICLKNGYLQYDFPKYVTFGKINKNLSFSDAGTKRLIQGFLKSNLLGKLFIEPHLKQRLRLNNTKVKYHGCQAVRHDDHIHLQLK
ncbi:hypothetical protein [Aquimarina pacifica]|uniref:hypothetical protein n=1 Tax=Aquimarina pacifica TaxID=1296415 RepID=UPI001F4D2CDB|nr:hypothetical protein [Aquimarina pacifica]